MERIEKLLLRSSPSADTSPEMGIALGHALAVEHKKVVVGTDLVKSSPMMKNALISGLISSGADVIDIGIVSGPVAAYAARMGDCCVYVTEYRQLDLVSGYLLINSDGGLFGLEQIRHLEQLCMKGFKLPDYKSLGVVKEYFNATIDYNRNLQGLFGDNTGGTIVLNCNCGVATDSAPQILNKMGTDIISINAQKDRDFISDSLSTKDADIHHMKDLVASDAGSIGISINRIGTMMRAFNESGEPLTDEEVLKIIVLFTKPTKIVLPMDISGSIGDLFFGKYIVDMDTSYPDPEPGTKELIMAHPDAGSVHKAMVETGADLGYYEGGFIFKNMCQHPDAIHACMILAQFCGSNNLEKTVAAMPQYYDEKKSYRINCSRNDFIRSFNSNLPDINPVKVYEDGCWRIDMDGGNFFVDFDPLQEDTVQVVAESSDRLYLISLIEVIDSLIEKSENGQ